MLSKSENSKSTKNLLNPEYSDEEDANDPFLRNFRRNNEDEELKEKRKKMEEYEKSSEELRRKMKQFLTLWLRQIVIYSTHYVLHLSMTNHNMTSLLDVKPSIVKATNIKYALLSLMNPRLQSFHQVNNFKSMKRILDNIVTYFFQNFMTVKERGLVSYDLSKLSMSANRLSVCKNIDFNDFFDSEEEFKKFYEYMDMSYYIANVREYDLSLLKQDNKDYTPATIERIYNVYKDGVQIFKQTNAHVTQF